MAFQGTHPNQIQTVAATRRVSLTFRCFLIPDCGHWQQMLSSGDSKMTWLDNTHHLPVLLSIKSIFQRTFPQYFPINPCLEQCPSDLFTSHGPCVLSAFRLVTRPHYGPNSQHMTFRGTYSHQMCPSQASGSL